MFRPNRTETKCRGWRDDHGNASVEFALIAPLLMLIALAVIQLMLAVHVRSVLVSAARDGARVAALGGSQLSDGESRTREILESNVAGAAVTKISARRQVVDDVEVIEMNIEADLPLLGIYGPTTMTMSGHAFVE